MTEKKLYYYYYYNFSESNLMQTKILFKLILSQGMPKTYMENDLHVSEPNYNIKAYQQFETDGS